MFLKDWDSDKKKENSATKTFDLKMTFRLIFRDKIDTFGGKILERETSTLLVYAV